MNQLQSYRLQLESVIRRGRALAESLAADPGRGSSEAEVRVWQRDCAALVNELSGGSKAHWLARAYSEAFLLRSGAGGIVLEATAVAIVGRVLDVLGRARASLSQLDGVETGSAQAAPTHRFDFVHNGQLRPVVEQAYLDGRRAFEDGRFAAALVASCSVLEAIITDALEQRVDGTIADWSFETRIAAAERAGLIRGGCARLPAPALTYRDLADAGGEIVPDAPVSERDARLAGQVLHVVMGDLDPGR